MSRRKKIMCISSVVKKDHSHDPQQVPPQKCSCNAIRKRTALPERQHSLQSYHFQNLKCSEIIRVKLPTRMTVNVLPAGRAIIKRLVIRPDAPREPTRPRPRILVICDLRVGFLRKEEAPLAAKEGQVIQVVSIEIDGGEEIGRCIALVATRAGERADRDVLVVGHVVAAPKVFALVADGKCPLAWEAADDAGNAVQRCYCEEAANVVIEVVALRLGEIVRARGIPGARGPFGWRLCASIFLHRACLPDAVDSHYP